MSTFYAIKEYIRVGDLMEMDITVDGNAIDEETPEIVNVIRSDGMLVIIVISTNCDGYNENTCDARVDDHWNWKTLDISEIKIEFGNGFILDSSNNQMLYEVKSGKIEQSSDNQVNDHVVMVCSCKHCHRRSNLLGWHSCIGTTLSGIAIDEQICMAKPECRHMNFYTMTCNCVKKLPIYLNLNQHISSSQGQTKLHTSTRDI